MVGGKGAAVPMAILVVLAICAVGAPTAEAACPNEAFRTGAGASLAPCRAYELVSPPQKAGGGVRGDYNVRVSPDGDSVGFYSTTGFADPSGTALINSYAARRSGDGWVTQNLEAPQTNTYGFLEVGAPASSPDLTETIQTSRRALTPGAIEGGSNLYLQDDLTGARHLIVAKEGTALYVETRGSANELALGGTPDWSNLLLGSAQALTPDSPEGSNLNLYEFDQAGLRLASRLPATGADPGGAPATEAVAPAGPNPMSPDGTRVAFTAGGQVYERLGGQVTIAVSASQREETRGELPPSGTENATASADGREVYFTSNDDLVEGNDTEGTKTLYRFDADTGTLSDVIPEKPAGGADVGAVLAVSPDGQTAYFTSDAILAPGAREFTNEGSNLYAIRAGRVELVAALEEFSTPPSADVNLSADGRFFAFEAATPIGEEAAVEAEEAERRHRDEELEAEGKEPPKPACENDLLHPGRCVDVYVFDADAGTVVCATCGGAEVAGSRLGGTSAVSASGPVRVTSVLDDGTVFVESPKALVPRDVNGLNDVYAWRAGVPQLISTGISDQPSTFADADASGDDAFFVTSQSLVPIDTDATFDVYDARSLGGLASQFPPSAPAPCGDESCRGASPPPLGAAPSGASAGEGDCAGLARAAATARRHAADFRHAADRARRTVRHRGTTAARTRARKLVRRSKAAARRARALRKQSTTCQGGNR